MIETGRFEPVPAQQTRKGFVAEGSHQYARNVSIASETGDVKIVHVEPVAIITDYGSGEPRKTTEFKPVQEIKGRSIGGDLRPHQWTTIAQPR